MAIAMVLQQPHGYSHGTAVVFPRTERWRNSSTAGTPGFVGLTKVPLSKHTHNLINNFIMMPDVQRYSLLRGCGAKKSAYFLLRPEERLLSPQTACPLSGQRAKRHFGKADRASRRVHTAKAGRLFHKLKAVRY